MARAKSKPATQDTIALADELVATLGKPVADKTVKAALKRAGLPLAKDIDTYSNDTVGITYLIEIFAVGPKGKYVPAVSEIEFHPHFAGPFPEGLVRGASSARVTAVLGKPFSPGRWFRANGDQQITAELTRGKLTSMTYGIVPGALDGRFDSADE
ncbi:MAG: hypothetical protein QM831_10825 [Kofleriaceae bacterium]